MKDVDKINLRSTEDGTIIPVKAVPGASRDKVVGVLGDCLKITTSAAAEKGKANSALAKTLAKALGVERRSVQVHSGLTNPRKEFLVTGLGVPQVRIILEKL